MSSGLRHVPLHEGLVADDRSDNEARRAEDVEGGAHDGAQGSVSSKRLCSRWAYVGAATLVVFGVVVALIVALAGSKTPDGCDWDSWRLPKTFTPSAYRWTVYPEFSGDYGFNGTLEIDVTAETSNAGCVVLNAVDLDVHDASLVSGAGESVIKVTKREKRELVLVHLAKIPAKGDSLTLRLSYTGSLNRNMEGLYLSTFEEGGATVPMVATQFESTAARRAFPCFDEPAFKAKFSVTVQNIPDGYVALGNTPEDAAATTKATGALGRRAVAFEPTPRMSTYLVAVVVGPLSSVSGKTAPAGEGSHSIGVKVWARKGMEDKLEFALGTAIRVLEFFQQFYQVPYPLAKVDMVAIPDFAAGAMENWGLVTYRETALLTNATTSSVSSQLRVAIVVAHELGHQWFGNLVTMEWWDELWLNEGFASFMEFKGAAHARPSLSPWDGFIPDTWSRALHTDSFASTHPLRRPDVVTPGQIEEQFDDISYAKGASVIRMVASHCEENKPGSFAEGLHQYLTTHAYGNAESGDLWHALSKAADLPNLPADMKSQTYEPGFPLVSVEVESEEEEGKPVQHLVVTQQRFFHSDYSREQVTTDEQDILWWVPIVYKTEHGERAEPVVVEGGMRDRGLGSRILYEPAKDGFLKVNLNATAYFRTMYPAPLWHRLRDYLLKSAPVENRGGRPFFASGGKLTADDRAQLVDDLWASTLALVANGDPRIGSGLTAGDAVSFLDLLRCELSYTVWVPALRHLGHLDSMLHPDAAPTADFTPSPELAAVIARAAQLLTPTLEALGWESGPDDLPSTALLRDRLLRAGSYFNVSLVVDEAWQRWQKWQDQGDASGVQAGALRTVAESVVRWGHNATWQAVRQRYEAETDPYRRSTLLTALAKARDPALLRQTLIYAMGPHVRKQDKTYLISSVAANPMGRAIAWQFFEDNFPALEKIYGGGGFALSGLVTSVAGHFATADGVSRVNDFFKTNPLPAAKLEIQRAREAVEARILFRNHGTALASVVNATQASFGPECTGAQCAACHTS